MNILGAQGAAEAPIGLCSSSSRMAQITMCMEIILCVQLVFDNNCKQKYGAGVIPVTHCRFNTTNSSSTGVTQTTAVCMGETNLVCYKHICM